MELLNNFYTVFHHTSQASATLSTLDVILFTIKGIISLIGTIVILSGAVTSAYRFFIVYFMRNKAMREGLDVDFVRRDLGRTIVLGLEFIIAADVVETTTAPDYYTVGILAIVVIIRTFLSFTLNKEIATLTSAQQNKLRT